MSEVVGAILGREPDGSPWRSAVVASLSPLTVTIDGAAYAAQSWVSWPHHTGDRVLVIRGPRGVWDILGSQAARPQSRAMMTLWLRSVRNSLARRAAWRADCFQSIARRSMPG